MKRLQTKRDLLFSVTIIILTLFLTLTAFLGLFRQKELTAKAVGIGSLTVSDFDTRTDGIVFDGDELQKLYDLLTGKQKSTISDVEALGTKTSADIRTLNGGSNVIVPVAGKNWYAAYFSKSGNDAILTLWQNSSDLTSAYAPFANSSTSDNYPASMYGTSQIRAVALNNGGSYTTNGSTLTTVSPSASHTYKYFTVQNITGSLYDYIATPAAMTWQATVSNKINNNAAYDLSNDGYSTTMTTLTTINHQNKAGYDAWKNDKLWLVGQGEIGSSGSPAGLWKTNSAMIGAAANYWERTAASSGGASVNANAAHNQNSSGVTVTTTMNVRPAFHLNLSKAAKSKVETTKVPTIPAQTYNGIEQTFDFTTITDYSAAKMKITNIVYDGTLPAGYATPSVVAPDAPATSATKVKFTEAGTYTVTFESLMQSGADGSKTQWFFGRNPEKTTDTATLTVNKAKLATPSFGSGANSAKPFDGSELTFTANNYPNDKVAATNTVAYPRDPLSVKIKDGSVLLSPQPAVTATSNGTLEVIIRNAGNYGAEFTIADPTNYEWSDGTSTPKTVNFTVNPLQLTITSTTTETGNAWGWSADSTTASGTVTVSGFYIGDGTSADPADVVNLKLEITDSTNATNYLTGTDNGNGSYTFTVDSSISIFGGTYTSGTYYLKPVLSNGSAGTHDGNYELTTALSGLNGGLGYKLVIGTASAGLPSYTWTYTEDGGSDQAMPSDNKLTYKFNTNTTSGAVYEVTVDTSGFAAAYIAIDTSKYTNGYKNRSASVAGHYVTTLALKTTDSDHTFSLPGGGTSTTSEITFEWDIEKADYDFTNVKWQYTDTDGNTKNYPAKWNATNSVWEYLDEDGNVVSNDPGIPWYGENYTLTLTGLPSGVTVNNPTGAYTGNKEKFISVNGYQAECNGITSDTSNYNAIPANLLKLDWKIVKGKVIIRASGSWTTSQQGSDSNIFYVPTLQNVSGVEYEYYDLGTTANSPGPGTLLGGLTDVTSVLGTKHYYYVKAVVASGVSSDGVTLWSDAIEIVDETNPAPKYGACTKAFETGDNRTPVQITLNGAPYTYDGQEHGVLNDGSNNGELEIKVGGNVFPTSRFTILYYEYDANNSADHFKGTPIPDPPTNAGKYVIEIQLTATAAQDYYATDEYFEFEIKPFVLDMSQVKWGYIDKDGNEVEYNPASPLQYGLDENGDPVKHNIVLIGLPKGDANGDAAAQLLAKMYEESGLGNDGSDSTKPQIITYTGNKDETAVTGGSGGGKYTTTATLSGLSPNFKLGSLPTFFTEDPGTGEVSSTQDWKVEPKKLNAPKDDNTHSFTGEALDILTFAGLDPEELGLYYEITSITYYDKDFNTHNIYTNPHASGNAQRPTEAELQELKDALATVKNAGTYMLTARLIDSNNVKFLVNGVPGTAPSYLAQIDIQKLKLTVTGWTNPSAPKNNTPWEPTYDGNFPAGVVENKITDERGNEVSEAEWTVGWNKIYYQTLRPTSGNEDNVEIEYAAGVDETVSFDRGDEEGVIYGEIEKPTYTNVSTGTLNGEGVLESTFNGEEQDFTPEGLSSLISQNRIKLYAVDGEGNEKEVGIEYFKQKNAGKYKVIARINGNFKWKDSKDKADVVFEFEVQKAQVKAEWDTTGERPVLSIPEGFEDYVEYEYRDEKGNVVAEKNLKKGVSYTVTAKVKEGETENIEFLFTDLDGNEVIGGSMESGFTVPGGNGLNDLFGLPEDFPLWQIIVICICLILFIIFMIITGKKRKEKKEADEETKKYEEDMMLNS